MTERSFQATCALGLEAVLADELTALGAGNVEARHGVVHFVGDLACGYAACLWLRSATRVQELLAHGPARSREELYALVAAVDWSRSITPQQTLVVEGTVKESFASDARFPRLVVKDAICDQLRKRTGARPSVDKERPDLRIRLTMQDSKATVCRDLAGAPLQRRGYRDGEHRSALDEATAAGLLLHTEWDRRAPLCDPMCGSATFLIEAAWLAMDRAPGLGRDFAFTRWPDADAAAWQRLHDDATARAARGADVKLRLAGNDRHAGAIAVATRALAAAGVTDRIELRHGDCRGYVPPFPTARVLCNPPYGLGGDGDTRLTESWQALGDFLRAECEGAVAWILSGNAELASHLGLRAPIKMPVKNGAIDCRWLCCEVPAPDR